MTRLDTRLTRLEVTAPAGAAGVPTLADWQATRALTDEERDARIEAVIAEGGPRAARVREWLDMIRARRAAARAAEEGAGGSDRCDPGQDLAGDKQGT